MPADNFIKYIKRLNKDQGLGVFALLSLCHTIHPARGAVPP